MLRSKSEAAARRNVEVRIVKTLEEDKSEENVCVRDAWGVTEDDRRLKLKTLPAAQYPLVDLGSGRIYTRQPH